MKKKTRNRIEIIVLLAVAVFFSMKACKADAEYEKRLQDADSCRLIYMDDQPVLIPIE